MGISQVTLYPCSSHQNSWDLWTFMPVHATKNAIYRYWSIAKKKDWLCSNMASWEMPQPWRFEGENLIMKYEEKNPRTTTWMFFIGKSSS